MSGVFRLWGTGCAHVGTDLRVGGRESLADAIRQSEQGGAEGGRLVATGTPEQIAACKASHTGRALRPLLRKASKKRTTGQ